MMNFKKTLIASTLLGVSMVVTPGLMTNAFATSDTSTEEVSLKDVRQEMSEVSEMLKNLLRAFAKTPFCPSSSQQPF